MGSKRCIIIGSYKVHPSPLLIRTVVTVDPFLHLKKEIPSIKWHTHWVHHYITLVFIDLPPLHAETCCHHGLVTNMWKYLITNWCYLLKTAGHLQLTLNQGKITSSSQAINMNVLCLRHTWCQVEIQGKHDVTLLFENDVTHNSENTPAFFFFFFYQQCVLELRTFVIFYVTRPFWNEFHTPITILIHI